MQNHKYFVLLCVVSVGMNAFVAGIPVAQPRPKLSAMKLSRSIKNNAIANQDALEVVSFSKTKEAIPRDYLTDLIWRLLQLTVGGFLGEVINYNCLQITDKVTEGQARLTQTLAGVDDETEQDLRDIIDIALGEALDIVQDVLDKLGLVLPSLTSTEKAIHSDPNDIIEIILGMTLEEFLIEIRDILERSDTLLANTATELNEIAGRVSSSIEEILRTTATEMGLARDVIRPVLTNLYQILSDRHPNE